MSMMGDTEFGQRQVRKGHIQTSAWALNRLGWLARERGDAATARARLEQSLAIYRELDDKLGIAWTAVTLGEVLIMLEETSLATSVLEEGLNLAREQGEGFAIGWALNHLGHLAQLNGDLEQAARLHDESLAMFQSLGPYKSGLAWAHHGLAETALAQNNAELASQHFVEALILFQEMDDSNGMTWCVGGMAGVAVLNRKLEQAAWGWGAEENLRKTFEARESPAARATHERLLAEVRQQLGEETFNSRWAEGESTSVEQILAEVIKP
jgi:tetratricopeptide (TPR) repeat protein